MLMSSLPLVRIYTRVCSVPLLIVSSHSLSHGSLILKPSSIMADTSYSASPLDLNPEYHEPSTGTSTDSGPGKLENVADSHLMASDEVEQLFRDYDIPVSICGRVNPNALRRVNAISVQSTVPANVPSSTFATNNPDLEVQNGKTISSADTAPPSSESTADFAAKSEVCEEYNPSDQLLEGLDRVAAAVYSLVNIIEHNNNGITKNFEVLKHLVLEAIHNGNISGDIAWKTILEGQEIALSKLTELEHSVKITIKSLESEHDAINKNLAFTQEIVQTRAVESEQTATRILEAINLVETSLANIGNQRHEILMAKADAIQASFAQRINELQAGLVIVSDDHRRMIQIGIKKEMEGLSCKIDRVDAKMQELQVPIQTNAKNRPWPMVSMFGRSMPPSFEYFARSVGNLGLVSVMLVLALVVALVWQVSVIVGPR